LLVLGVLLRDEAEGAFVLQPVLDQLERGAARDEQRDDRGREDDQPAQREDWKDVGHRNVGDVLLEAVEAAGTLLAGETFARILVGHGRADCNPGPPVRQGESPRREMPRLLRDESLLSDA